MNDLRPAGLPGVAAALRAPSAIASMVTGLILLAFIVLGHDGRRVGQLVFLALPAVLWLLWPLRSEVMHRLRTAMVWLWVVVFVLDGVARAYLQTTYQAAPDGALVLGAIANTNAREGAEYLSMYGTSLLGWAALVLTATVLVLRYAGRGARRSLVQATRQQTRGQRRVSRWGLALLGLALAAMVLAYASKPWRRLHPVLFWNGWVQSVKSLQDSWGQQQAERSRQLQRAQAAAPVITADGPATVVLVITDSVNRDNMGLYGYARATTPALQAHKARLGEQMQVLQHAWSADASTLPSLRNMFHFGQPAQQDPLHALALARAAGYKTYWISNHDDLGIEQQHAQLADVVDMVNRTPGRAGASLDSELLDCVQEALADPAERKFLVVHLLGTHPHYRLRFPSGANPFVGLNDDVEAELEDEGRPAWVRQFRREYDAALLYHDSVVAQLFEMTQTHGKPKDYRAWMYLSDHGQEVGHDADRAGHSPGTASGYRIPAVLWRSQSVEGQRLADATQPFRADWLGWTLADLLRMQWSGFDATRSVMRDSYHWQPPTLPTPVASFTQ